eukprot:TRINITY_DN31742_c0_g1_i2.p2 TRINITY_DN31742_c0_g1~~TRINITY_DN31742_c0_g1_i2.p2  ORF type:complete len:151 (-),score=28.41 TRINITY_DN31742_c0_g1_i2:665-1081(-)
MCIRDRTQSTWESNYLISGNLLKKWKFNNQSQKFANFCLKLKQAQNFSKNFLKAKVLFIKAQVLFHQKKISMDEEKAKSILYYPKQKRVLDLILFQKSNDILFLTREIKIKAEEVAEKEIPKEMEKEFLCSLCKKEKK